MRTDLLTQVIQPGRFSSPEANLTFHIRERALNGELIGLVMHDTRDKTQAQSYLAERGMIVKQDPTAYLVMIDRPHHPPHRRRMSRRKSLRSTSTPSISTNSNRKAATKAN